MQWGCGEPRGHSGSEEPGGAVVRCLDCLGFLVPQLCCVATSREAADSLFLSLRLHFCLYKIVMVMTTTMMLIGSKE